MNGEYALKLNYEIYFKSKLSMQNHQDWFFFGASRFCSKVDFMLKNTLKCGNDLIFDIKRLNSDKSEEYIKKGRVLKNSDFFPYLSITPLEPGDAIMFFLHQQKLNENI